MNEAEYMKAVQEIEYQSSMRKKEIHQEYALSNNQVEIGDIVIDHFQTVRVKSICVYGTVFNNELPGCVYTGKLLKNDFSDRKKYEEVKVYQPNLVRIIRENINIEIKEKS